MQRIGKWGCKKEFQIAKLLVLGSFCHLYSLHYFNILSYRCFIIRFSNLQLIKHSINHIRHLVSAKNFPKQVAFLSEILSCIPTFLFFASLSPSIYANKIIIGPMGTLWIKRFILGFMFGWVLIPVAIIKCLIFR